MTNVPPKNSKRFVDVVFESLERLIPLDYDIDLEMLAADIADDVFPDNEYVVRWYDEDIDVDLLWDKPGYYVIPVE